MKVKKVMALLLAGTLVLSAFTGCGINKDATVATMKGQKVTLGLVNFMCRYQQAASDDMYRAYFGEGVWTQDMGAGSTMADSVKDQAVDTVHAYYTLKSHVDEYSVSLSDEEKQKITETATAFMNANSRDALNEMGATQAIVEEMLTLATIQDKMKEAIYAKADTGVTDEEANMRAYTMVKVDTEGSYDENYNFVDYTDEQKEEARRNAKIALESVKSGKSLEDAAESAGLSTKEGTYDADDTSLDEEVKKVLDGLQAGKVSDLIETEDALYIVRLDKETDKEATEENREKIVKERQQKLYDETLEKWQEDDGWKVKERKLESIVFKNNFTQQNATAENAEESVVETENAE